MSGLRWFFVLFTHDLRAQLSRSGPWVYASVYAALGMFFMIAAGGAFEGVQVGVGGSNNLVDSPYAMAAIALSLSLFTILNISSEAGWAACRDVAEGSAPLVYTTPVPRVVLLSARFATALVIGMIITAGIPIGLSIGANLPFLEAERFGAFGILNGVVPYLGFILPNVLAATALFFSVALITRRMFPNTIVGVVLLVGYLASQTLIRDLDNEVLAVMIDPFGLRAFFEQTRYWSPFERNTLLPWPAGWALANRALWVGVALGGLAVAARFARLDHDGLQWFRWMTRTRTPEPTPVSASTPRAGGLPKVPGRFDGAARFRQLMALTSRAVRDVIGHRYFWGFVAAALAFQLLQSQAIGSMFGTETWPVTYGVLEVLEGTLGLFVLIVITFYAGDLVWQERDLRSAAFFDTAPLPDVLPLIAKTVALSAVVVGLYATIPVIGVIVQFADGYTHFELGLYAEWLVLGLFSWMPLIALTMAIHVIVNQKVLGHVIVVMYWILQSFRTSLGFEYHLFWFGSDPGRTYSDMNDWGTSLGPSLLYQTFWLAIGVALLAFARLFVVRGTDPGFRARWAEARRRLDRPTLAVGGFATVTAVVLGAFIVVQSAVLRPFRTSVDQRREVVRYEKTYKEAWESKPHPRVVDVDLTVDFYPDQGSMQATGALQMVNREAVPIEQMMLSVNQDLDIEMQVKGATVEELDKPLGLHVATFASPLAPGAETTLTFQVDYQPKGFDNDGMDTNVVSNGSFVSSGAFIPSLGYSRGQELSDKAERRKYDLPPRPRMLDLDDPMARTRNYITDDGDRVSFRAVVSTVENQIALAPGALIDERVEGGRRFFTFEAEDPILYFFSFLSGAWEVERAEVDGIGIEVYHHPTHTYNVQRMIDGVTDSVRSFGERFGPYQYNQIRIVEFPRYAQFAQSFPSTIPFSESIGFIAKIRDPDEDVDYPYYVTAHEVAHQWWAHQIISGDGQGATVLVETLAQYSAITLMDQVYGSEHVHRFTRYEQDNYFRGRTVERDREVPLMRVENQGYIHYRKGGVVMYELAQEFGQDRMDQAIRSFLDEWRYQGPPYPTARDFIDHLREAVPDASDRLKDSFERIVLYQNRTSAATATENADGTWTVKLDLVLERTEADEVGEETEIAFDESVQVGVYAGTEAERRPLQVEWRRLQGPETTIELTVPEKPSYAGVDPNHLLLDRARRDNVVAVEVASD
ncbi:MAG: M1 family aminopeptidase [Myxococcota bacterium]